MTQETLKKLCCPFDKSSLDISFIRRELQERIIEGLLECPECKRIYPIIKSIPIMNPDEYREFDLERPILERWKKELALEQNSDTGKLPG